MYELNDTIVAVSSPATHKRAIVRITGPATIEKINQIFSPPINVKRGTRDKGRPLPTTSRGVIPAKAGTRLVPGSITVDARLRVDAKLYLFLAPHSYTGQTLAEIHLHTNSSVTEALMSSFLAKGLRMAGPGEFTARSYLNGKMDLAQAEAVGEIVSSSNKLQLAAAERLLAGQLAETTAKIRSSIMDCLSLIEAGLDFSSEDIEFITRPEALDRLISIKNQLEQLLAGSIRYESVIDLSAVGIAGAPNAGKSSLLNNLLGKTRSIISHQRKTTRDVLTGLLRLAHCECVLFDCAGLTLKPDNILDELAQQAAIEALRRASVVVFCVDISKKSPAEWAEDISIRKLIEPGPDTPGLIPVATKSDLLSKDILATRLSELNELFDADFLTTSVKTGTGIKHLKDIIDCRIIEPALGSMTRDPSDERRVTSDEIRDTRYEIALTARHRRAITEAIENVAESVNELKADNDEVAAMMMRAAYQELSNIERQHIDERILENIFSHFCIGK